MKVETFYPEKQKLENLQYKGNLAFHIISNKYKWRNHSFNFFVKMVRKIKYSDNDDLKYQLWSKHRPQGTKLL